MVLSLASLLCLFAASGDPAQAVSRGVAAHPPTSPLATTNCHWHTDGHAYWAHCLPTESPYTFQMHIWCNNPPFPVPSYEWDSDIAQSPQQIYTSGISCIFGGSVTSAWVTAG